MGSTMASPYNISPHILLKKNCCGLNLGEGLCMFTFFLFPDFGLYLLKGLIFNSIYFESRDTKETSTLTSIKLGFATFN